jgi:uncharacterized protein YidB (DUF937 family)
MTAQAILIPVGYQGQLEARMGLLDILNGMQNGPKGQPDPNAKGGMSPITMAILALLAYKAYQKISGSQAPASSEPGPARLPDSNTIKAGLPGGGLGDLLKGGLGDMLGGRPSIPSGNAANAGSTGGLEDLLKGSLGGLLGGAATGSVLSGGLGELIKGLQRNGLGDVADSWVSKNPNKDISPRDLAKSIGMDDIDTIARQTGLSRDDLLSGLSRQLPQVIDQLTPEGRLPTEDEAARWV